MPSHSSQHLSMLTTVLEEAMVETIESKGMSLSEALVQQLISHLGKVIMDRYTAGETDPKKLRAIAVESVSRKLVV